MRAKSHSVSLHQSGTCSVSVSQPASPMWSGWKCVTMRRFTGLPSSALAKILRQRSCVSVELRPLSTMLQPSPSSRSQRLM